MPGRRLFVAVPLAEPARQAVASLMAGLAAGPPRLRWVRPESLHLTLRFLGPTLDDALPGVREAVTEAAARVRPFDVRLGGTGAFPPRGRPRVLWVGVVDGEPGLAALAAALEDALAARGWPRDDRPFRAHLTLARSDGVAGAERIVEAAAEHGRNLVAAWTADRVVLFESLSGGGPARYAPLHSAPLGERPVGPSTPSLPSPVRVR